VSLPAPSRQEWSVPPAERRRLHTPTCGRAVSRETLAGLTQDCSRSCVAPAAVSRETRAAAWSRLFLFQPRELPLHPNRGVRRCSPNRGTVAPVNAGSSLSPAAGHCSLSSRGVALPLQPRATAGEVIDASRNLRSEPPTWTQRIAHRKAPAAGESDQTSRYRARAREERDRTGARTAEVDCSRPGRSSEP
jgi:hypothetical protein